MAAARFRAAPKRRARGAAAREEIALTGLDVTVRLRRSPRAARFTLSVSRLDGRPQLTLPERASAAEAQEFLERQAEWLAEAMGRVPPPLPVAHGRAFPFEGRQVMLEATGPGRRPPALEDGRLRVSGAPDAAARKALAFVKASAREALAPAAKGYAARLGQKVARVTLRDTRSRWGSCTAQGALSFSWRLAMAPPAVLDYVAAHEAAHLVEMNHSPDFWALVARLRPDWKEHRDWLRAHGPALHRVRFDAA